MTGRSSPCRSAPHLSLQLPGLEAVSATAQKYSRGVGTEKGRHQPCQEGVQVPRPLISLKWDLEPPGQHGKAMTGQGAKAGAQCPGTGRKLLALASASSDHSSPYMGMSDPDGRHRPPARAFILQEGNGYKDSKDLVKVTGEIGGAENQSLGTLLPNPKRT